MIKKSSGPLLISKLISLIMEGVLSESASVLVVDQDKNVLYRESLPEDKFKKGDMSLRVIREALNNKNPIMIDSIKAEYCFKDEISSMANSKKNILCVPLIIKNYPAGAIYLERNCSFGPYSTRDLELLIAFQDPIKQVLKECFDFNKINGENLPNSKPLIIGQSKSSLHVLRLIEQVKDQEVPVFIWGESGTGKELIARNIHYNGSRKNGKFIAINSGPVPEYLLESEHIGYVKGAFTVANRNKPGLIEEADEGTFFLDEVGDLPLNLQAKLLRMLQEKEIRRIGENRTRSVNVRFISATNKNIEEEIERGNFREDLYYRLKIIGIEIAPLRERKEDVISLISYFVGKYCNEMGRERLYFSPEGLELLINYSWPGNIRELQNEIQRCLILCGEENLIKEEILSPKINPDRKRHTSYSYDFFNAKAEFEKRFLNQALSRFNYNKAETAAQIGLSRQGLFKLIKRHNINVPKRLA